MKENEEYWSSSTIDTPPKEQTDEQQEEMFGPAQQRGEKVVSEPAAMQFEMQIRLKDAIGGGKPITIPVVAGEARVDRIVEILHRALLAERTQRILCAVLGEQEYYEVPSSVCHTQFKWESISAEAKRLADRMFAKQAAEG